MLSKEIRKKISDSHKKSPLAIAARKKLHISQIGKPRDIETRKKMAKTQFKKGQIPWNRGVRVTKQERLRLSRLMMGKKHSLETRLKMSRAHQGKQYTLGYSPTLKTRLKLSAAHSGTRHYNWKGGVTPLNQVIRRSLKYREWRTAIFKRDNYTCVFCKRRGGELNADHIKPFAYYPKLRFRISNGRTLCVSCHKQTNTYGIKARKTAHVKT